MQEAFWPIIAASIFSILIILLLIYMVIFQRVTQVREARLRRWDSVADNVLMEAILFEESDEKDPYTDALEILESEKFHIPKQLTVIMQNETFRRRMMNKIVTAKRNVSGTASENLSRLFTELGLDLDILSMLSTTVWYKQATALDLIGFMKLSNYRHLVDQYVNDQSGLIRMEAQNAVLRFSGFEGLHFLIEAKYPLSEWQQMKFIDELSNLPDEEFKGIDEWLTSQNDTVVIFALKLIRIYHRFELFQEVLECLNHKNPEVRFYAISVLKVLPSAEAVPVLLELYPRETTLNQVEILKVLKAIASETEIGFLVGLLHDPHYTIQLEATRALQNVGPEGKEWVSKFEDADDYPLNKIIAQVKEEER
ncbi:HEAT repeat domain-containing protein [Daejeonella sp.]|uniref:HEAT repeat domain-containing protein n=1 Tax=Daejeonella sp. TaxID=2805397 RepID=UPI003983D79D